MTVRTTRKTPQETQGAKQKAGIRIKKKLGIKKEIHMEAREEGEGRKDAREEGKEGKDGKEERKKDALSVNSSIFLCSDRRSILGGGRSALPPTPLQLF